MKKWTLYDKDDRQVSWPDCIKNLQPPTGFTCQAFTGSELPTWIWSAFNKQGIFDRDEMIIPLRPISILGVCTIAQYSDCPNMPNHYLDKIQDRSSLVSNPLGPAYYWFDFDIVSSDQALIKLRMAVNSGDADCNDGYWGAVWTRKRGELVANILSTGDMETTIQVVSDKYIDLYKPYNSWMPFGKSRKRYANDLELEKLIGLAIRICFRG